MGVLGMGGLFFRARDPETLNAWYREHLSIGGGCAAEDAPEPPNQWVWQTLGGPMVFSAFTADSDYFAADRPFMINLRVSDLDGLLEQLNAAGIEIITKPEWDSPEVGKFARIHDPEGNAIELWEPPTPLEPGQPDAESDLSDVVQSPSKEEALDSGRIGRDDLGARAYIIANLANCLYQPDIDSAIRMTPPYGSKVTVVRDEGDWVLVRYFGKQAWCPRENLNADLVPCDQKAVVGRSPDRHRLTKPAPVQPDSWIEYGPRGGRYIRTSSGFRRYL